MSQSASRGSVSPAITTGMELTLESGQRLVVALTQVLAGTIRHER